MPEMPSIVYEAVDLEEPVLACAAKRAGAIVAQLQPHESYVMHHGQGDLTFRMWPAHLEISIRENEIADEVWEQRLTISLANRDPTLLESYVQIALAQFMKQ